MKLLNVSMLKIFLNVINLNKTLQVYFWVLNKDEEFKKAFDLGATGVMTDYPTKLKLFLQNYSLE